MNHLMASSLIKMFYRRDKPMVRPNAWFGRTAHSKARGLALRRPSPIQKQVLALPFPPLGLAMLAAYLDPDGPVTLADEQRRKPRSS
jgi:hypothetical protein